MRAVPDDAYTSISLQYHRVMQLSDDVARLVKLEQLMELPPVVESIVADMTCVHVL